MEITLPNVCSLKLVGQGRGLAGEMVQGVKPQLRKDEELGLQIPNSRVKAGRGGVPPAILVLGGRQHIRSDWMDSQDKPAC